MKIFNTDEVKPWKRPKDMLAKFDGDLTWPFHHIRQCLHFAWIVWHQSKDSRQVVRWIKSEATPLVGVYSRTRFKGIRDEFEMALAMAIALTDQRDLAEDCRRKFIYRPCSNGYAYYVGFKKALWELAPEAEDGGSSVDTEHSTQAGLRTTATVSWLLLLVSALAGFDSCLSAEPPWSRHSIDNATRGADGVRLADVNGDGFPDIVTGWEEGGVTRICINPGPAKVREPWKAFNVGKTPNVEDAVFVDLDGDGRMDVVTCCEGKTRSMFVHWAPADPTRYTDEQAWKTEALPEARDRMMWMFCLPMQVDGRGGVDLVAAGKLKGAELGWFEAPERPRDLAAWKWHSWLEVGWVMSLHSEDMDGDGDADVLVSNRREPSRGVFWMENPGPEKARDVWSRHPVGGEDVEVMFLNTADLDGDGLKDVLCTGKPQRVLFFRRKMADGRGWERHEIVWPEDCGTAKAVAVGDIDGNGKPDMVYTCEHAEGQKSGCRWLSFRETPLEKDWTAHEIAGQEGVKFDLVELLDLDGDGDIDVLTCAEIPDLGVFWYENPRK